MTEYTVEIYRVMSNNEYLLAHISEIGWIFVPMNFTISYITHGITCNMFTMDKLFMDMDQIEKMYSMDIYI